MVDANGYIIASTMSERIGNFHEAASLMIKEKRDKIIVNKDNLYAGTKKGVTFPIWFNGNIIGGIGLTGDVKRVIGYGKVLQSFTELIVEKMDTDARKHLEEKTKNSLVQRWLLPACDIPEDDFIMQIERCRFHWKNQFTVIAIKIETRFEHSKHISLLQLLVTRFTAASDSASNIFTANDRELIWITSADSGKLKRAITSLQHAAKYAGEITLLFGIGRQYSYYKDAFASYTEAKKAISLAIPANPYIVYSDAILAIALRSIPKDMKEQCARLFLDGRSKEETAELIGFISVYVACNASINKTADVLHVHKNTVQYRIGKINELLGFDMRVIKNLLRLSLVCSLVSDTSELWL
jgi:carbohydrate diacid regulator